MLQKNLRFFVFCKLLIYNSLAYALVAYFATTIRFHFVLDKIYLSHLQPCSQKHMFCKASEFFKLRWICKTTSMFSGQHHDAFVPTKSSAFFRNHKFCKLYQYVFAKLLYSEALLPQLLKNYEQTLVYAALFTAYRRCP